MLFILLILSIPIIPAIIASGFDVIVMGITLIGLLALFVIFVFFSPVLLREYVV
jgi:hypothetical protein